MTEDQYIQQASEEELDEILGEIVTEMPTKVLLDYPEVFGFLKEELNNEILKKLAERGRASGDITDDPEEGP